MITSGFFNAVNGDRKYNAQQMSKYFDKIVGSGVFANPSTNLQVYATTGLGVAIQAGRGWIDSYWIDNSSAYLLTLEQANAVLPRIDAIVMKLNLEQSARTITLEVKKGTANATPVAPIMTRTDNVKEYCLATIEVDALATSITQADITDTRANTSVCGWVTGLIDQVDTTTLFAQWQSAYTNQFEENQDEFDEWFDNLQEHLSVSTLIREKRDRQYATTQGQTNFTINIPTYVDGYDILEVYVNGMRLLEDIDYTESNFDVTLTRGMDNGQPIEFVILTSNGTEGARELADDVDDLKLNKANKAKAIVQLPVASWEASGEYYVQDVFVSGVNPISILIVGASEDSIDAYSTAGIVAISQDANSITFRATTLPEVAINANVVNMGD